MLWAVFSNREEEIDLLLAEKSVDVNAKDHKNNTHNADNNNNNDNEYNTDNTGNKDKVKAVVTSTVVPLSPAPASAPAKANTPKENVELALKILRKNLPELKGKGRKKAIDDLIYLAAGHAEVNAR